MNLERLLESISGHFCGACPRPLACEKCVGLTLKQNGLDDCEANRARIRCLPYNDSGNCDPWGASKMCFELRKMRKEVEAAP